MNAANSTGYTSISKIRRKNTWWTIRDGVWNDPTIWISNGTFIQISYAPISYGYDDINPNLITGGGISEFNTLGGGLYTLLRGAHPNGCPQPGDIVYINHNVSTFIVGSGAVYTIILDELYVSQNCTLTLVGTGGNSLNLLVKKTLQCNGTINQNHQTNILHLAGAYNTINNFSSINGSTVSYCGIGDQDILDLPYKSLDIVGRGTKRSMNNLIISGTLAVRYNPYFDGGSTTDPQRSILEMGDYNLTVTGTTSIDGNSTLSKSGSGNLLFIGQLNAGTAGGIRNASEINFSGNPNVELRGGLLANGNTIQAGRVWNSGTGSWRFTTNNQTVQTNNILAPYACYFEIDPNITVTATGIGRWQINNDIEGTNSASRLDNRGYIGYAGVEPMQTGSLICSASSNTFEYNGTNQNIKDITYWNLRITERTEDIANSQGIKTAVNNITCLGTLRVSQNPAASTTILNTLQLGAYNLSVTGLTTLAGGAFLKSGAGNVVFGGGITTDGGYLFDISSGNPTVEVKGNIFAGLFYGSNRFKTGTGLWTLSTNNITISHQYSSLFFDAPILIDGPIRVNTNDPNNPNGLQHIAINQYLDANNSGSVFRVDSPVYFNNASYPIALFTSGTFDATSSINTNSVVGYSFNGDFTLPLTQYRGLDILGSGSKALSGNTTLNGRLYLTNSGSLQLSNYDLFVSGNTTITENLFLAQDAGIRKSGPGYVTFNGSFFMSNGTFDMSQGNPTVEFRNGMSTAVALANALLFGTGSYIFSTNNQRIQPQILSYTFGGPVIISGSITASFFRSTNESFIFRDYVDGTVAGSVFSASGSNTTFFYSSSIQPMRTGSLVVDTVSAANTWNYCSGSQDIRGTTYRNLSFTGGGTKTLQGNVSVVGTYTTASGVAVNLNGFALTNP